MRMLIPVLSTLEKAAQDGLREGGKAVLARARALSPTLTGESDASGFVAIDDLTAQVGFKDLVSRLNHENLDWSFPSGGQAKFLETAYDEVAIEEFVARRVRAAFGG